MSNFKTLVIKICKGIIIILMKYFDDTPFISVLEKMNLQWWYAASASALTGPGSLLALAEYRF